MFHRAVNWVKQKRWALASILSVVCVVSLLDVGVTVRNNPSSSLSSTDNTIGIGVGNELVITLGHVAYAAGSVDYTYDGTDDNVQFQAALDALPATGGRLVDVSAVQKNFAAIVTRAIPNVTIEGTGAGSYFTNNGATALFTAGGNGWKFSDLKVDYTAGLNMGATTDWMFVNVTEDTDYYAFRTSDDITAESIAIPTGRTATYVIAASDAPDHVKAQADYVCDGTKDNELLMTVINEMSDNQVLALYGTFNVRDTVFLYGINNITVTGKATFTQTHFAETSLTSNMGIGDTSLQVSDTTGFEIGDGVIVYADNYIDGYAIVAQISDIDTTTKTISLTRISNGGVLFEVAQNAKIATLFSYLSVAQSNYAGHTANSTDIIIEHMTFDGNASVVQPARDTISSYMLSTYKSIGIIIQNCTFINSKVGGLKLAGLYPTVKDSEFRDFEIEYYQVLHTGGEFGRNDGVSIDNNRFYNVLSKSGTRGGVIYFCLNMQSASITNNKFDTYGTYGIFSEGTVGGGVNHNIIISDNQFYNSTEASGHTIILNSSNYIYTITDNTFDMTSSTEKTAILVYGTAFVQGSDINISDNTFLDGRIQMITGVESVSINSNTFINSAANAPLIGYGTDGVTVIGNTFDVVSHIIYFRNNNFNWVIANNVIRRSVPLSTIYSYHATNNVLNIVNSNNINYISPGETRTSSGTFAASDNGTIAIAWHSPEVQDCYIKRIVVTVNSAAAAAATGKVGIADDNAGTNLGAEFFTAITLDGTGVYDSYVAGDTGAQTKYVLIQDSASATDGWVNMLIEANDSTATGSYYIEYVGK